MRKCPAKESEANKDSQTAVVGASQIQTYKTYSTCHVSFNHISVQKIVEKLIPTSKEMDELMLLDSVSSHRLLKNTVIVSSVILTNIPLFLSNFYGANISKQEA